MTGRVYDKTGPVLMVEWANKNLKPGYYYDKNWLVDEYLNEYPKYKRASVVQRVYNMCVNSDGRDFCAKPDSGHDLFYKDSSKQIRLWDPKNDPSPIYNTDSRSGGTRSRKV